MFEDNDFSGIPSLDDEQGLQNFLTNEAMSANGVVPPEPAPAPGEPQPAAAEPAAPAPAPVPTDAERIAALTAQINELNARLNAQTQAQQAQSTDSYSADEKQFIAAALSKGYSMDQINQTIMQHRIKTNPNAAMAQRVANLENYLRTQEYKAAETAFIDKVSSFGNKWGLSEQDLVAFGNKALSQGINIASANIDLETVFRAVYPEQYAIRLQRMTPTNSSQIYGGTSSPETSRGQAAKVEDAYVEQFLRQAMPNYGKK